MFSSSLSDLMKSTVVDESLSTTSTDVLFQRILTNFKRNLIIQFPIFVQPYTQQPLILYQIETVPVPIVDKNTKANSYTEILVKKPYIALNSETYIIIHQQELATYKRIGYECNKYKNVFAPGTLGNQPDTYLVPVNCMLGLGVWHIDAI